MSDDKVTPLAPHLVREYSAGRAASLAVFHDAVRATPPETCRTCGRTPRDSDEATAAAKGRRLPKVSVLDVHTLWVDQVGVVTWVCRSCHQTMHRPASRYRNAA